MNFIFHEKDGIKVAEVISDMIMVNSTQDALDVMADADYNGARRIIMHEKNICTNFFKLGTGLAGEILQKFVNYHVKLAIVGSFEKYGSKNFKSFVYECNKGNQLFFLPNVESAFSKLLLYQDVEST
ncbi:MAG: DUF4180 domain-containing protein [bacterium]